MGYNSTFLFLNDYLRTIENDSNLGKKIAIAATGCYIGKNHTNLPNGADVVNVSHADEMVMLMVGCNSCKNFGSIGNWRCILRDENDNNISEEEMHKRVLKCLARKLGIQISIRNKKKRKK